MSKSIDDLVASLPESRHGTGCWAERLDKRGSAFMEAIVAREQDGVKLLRGAILDTLASEFGVKIGNEALKRHMSGRCRCE